MQLGAPHNLAVGGLHKAVMSGMGLIQSWSMTVAAAPDKTWQWLRAIELNRYERGTKSESGFMGTETQE
jgi:hypothetical protein